MEPEEWTVVGGKKGVKKGRGKALSLKAAEALNQAQQGVWAAGVVVEGDDGDCLEGWGSPADRRSKGGRKRPLQERPPVDRWVALPNFSPSWFSGNVRIRAQLHSSSRCPLVFNRVAVAEEKIARAKEHIRKAPFFLKLDQLLAHHCPKGVLATPPGASASSGGDGGDDGEGDGWQWAAAPPEVHSLVIYGLGSLVASNVSCSQLALSDILMEKPSFAALVAAGDAWTFDPVLGDDDRTILQRHRLMVLDHDEAGARAVAAPTLFYMPHCEAVLYDNLLAANWSRAALPRVAIIGNSFRTYAERWEFKAKNATGRPHRILAVMPYVREANLGDTGAGLVQGFNDTSLLLFPPDALPAESDPFWAQTFGGGGGGS